MFTAFVGGCDSNPGQSGSKFDGIVQVEVLSVTPTSGKYATVRYKVTNKSNEKITRARATVTVVDTAGAALTTRPGHWVIRGTEPLETEASLENEVPLAMTDPTEAAGASIKVDLVRFNSGKKVEADQAESEAGNK